MLQRGLVTLIKALFRKYIRCLSVNGFKFMDISLSCAFFFAPLPPAPVCTPYMHPSLLMELWEYLKYLNEVRNQEKLVFVAVFFNFILFQRNSKHIDHVS